MSNPSSDPAAYTHRRIPLAVTFLREQAFPPENREELTTRLHTFAKKQKEAMLRHDEILAALDECIYGEEVEKWRKVCRKRSVRSESGVVVIAILTRNFGCPGKCVYCPTPKGMPKSYLPSEPAVMRATCAGFSPTRQIRMRLKSLHATGHDTSKVELIIMGGTWSALPPKYQTSYIRSCYHAFNGNDGKILSLDEEQKKNESADHRCVGLTLETRPDWITSKEIERMRMFGCTRVELGVQTLNDDIQKLTKRGHGVEEVARATLMLRNAGFKVVYHMMLNLPGSSPEEDIAMFKTLFSDPRFCPDQIKIYPCVLTKDAELTTWYADGRWKPYTEEELIKTIIGAKKFVPHYCRIIRVIRDIPGTDILAGSKTSNLRQLLHNKNVKCNCIRCREIRSGVMENCVLVRREYETVGGKEIFLSYEDTKNDKLAALLRLRIPTVINRSSHSKDNSSFPVLQNSSLVRELHVYGVQTPVGKKGQSAQHSGMGRKLLLEAEKISKKSGFKKLAIISGIGVRDYYRKSGYRLEDGYMVKKLK